MIATHDLEVEFSPLTLDDLNAVDELMRRDRRTLGFLPTEALKDYLHKGRVLGAKIADGKVVAYLLFASSYSRFKIVQLCVSNEFRSLGIARNLLRELRKTATTQTAITLNCRRDFPAHHMWPKFGFVSIGEKPGRSEVGHLLVQWHLALESADQMELGLFRARTTDETVDAIIDAQVFYDLFEPEGDASEQSAALQADFLVDSLRLWTTDEMFNEIDRNPNPARRQVWRSRMQHFPQVAYSPDSADDFYIRLTSILPDHTDSQTSDIKHLAKAAASDVSVFVSRDHSLLGKASEISDLTGVRVLSPTEMIIELHELLDAQSYSPDRVSGLGLGWYRITAGNYATLRFESFLKEREGQRQLKSRLDHHLSQPEQYQCEVLRTGNSDVALRIISSTSQAVLNVPLARIARTSDRELFGRFLIADTIAKAVELKKDRVDFDVIGLTPALMPDLAGMGFTQLQDTYTKFCTSGALSREEALLKVEEISPEVRTAFERMPSSELERRWAPASLGATGNYFLIPIRPGYAISLIDRQLSSNDMFGGDPSVLLRWENVYYRKASTSQKILRAPGRILWYVTHSQKQIVAVSHLDEVTIDTPKELLRRFKRFGVLGWDELYRMCAGDISVKLMALKFSHTFVFRNRVSLHALREVYARDGSGLTVRRPTSMPSSRFDKLLELGYADDK